jgi:pyrroline-5-carboxylate reductase
MVSSGRFAPDSLLLIDPADELRERLAAELQIEVAPRLTEQVTAADTLLLAVKPQIATSVCSDFVSLVDPGAMIVSLMAGFSVASLRKLFVDSSVFVRAMPNLPARVGAGITAFFVANSVASDQRENIVARASAIFESAGHAMLLDAEGDIDIATSLSGSGPAYFFYLVEAMTEAGVSLGLSTEQARALAETTFSGASDLLHAEASAANDLRRQVTSPGGTTAAAIASFERDGFKETVSRAVAAACGRARELSGE